MKNIVMMTACTSMVLIMNGCGGGSSPATSNSSATVPSTTQGTPDIAYIAFASDTTTRLDVLYKTDGTQANTSLVSNIMLPSSSNYEYEVLYDFETYGDYMYVHKIQKNANCLLLFCDESDIVKTKLADDTTSHMNIFTKYDEIIETSNISTDITNNGMYIRHSSGGNPGDDYTISKVLSDGTVTTLANTTGYEPNPFQANIQVDDDIYYGSYDGTQYSVIKLETNTDTFTHLNVFDNFSIVSMQTLNGKIYLGAGSTIGTDAGLYEYDTISGLAPTQVASYNGAGGSLPTSLYVFANKLYYLASTASGDNGFYVYDPINSSNMRLDTVPPNTFSKFFTYNNELYYTAQRTLYKTDGIGVSVVAVSSVTLRDQIVYEANGKLYFAGDDGTSGSELWQYDGTTASMVLDINPGAGDSMPRHITELNGEIVFQASSNGVNNNLYSYDGSTLTPLN